MSGISRKDSFEAKNDLLEFSEVAMPMESTFQRRKQFKSTTLHRRIRTEVSQHEEKPKLAIETKIKKQPIPAKMLITPIERKYSHTKEIPFNFEIRRKKTEPVRSTT